jgi:hypothetical protein
MMTGQPRVCVEADMAHVKAGQQVQVHACVGRLSGQGGEGWPAPVRMQGQWLFGAILYDQCPACGTLRGSH